MKRINIYLSALLSMVVVSSCDLTKLDNYKEPDAEIHGSLFDKADGVTLVEQDINGGGTLEYVEDYIKGVENPAKQTTVYKQNGTYRNSRVFAGEYLYFLPLANGNFVKPDTLWSWPKAFTGVRDANGKYTDRVVLSKGNNELNWTVEPYCRITLVSLIDDKPNKQIVAKFKVAKSSHASLASSVISNIGLYVHMTKGICGQPNKLYESVGTPDGTQRVDPNYVYTLSMAYGTTNGRLANGYTYYFRIGARVNVTDSKYNYLPETPITLAW